MNHYLDDISRITASELKDHIEAISRISPLCYIENSKRVDITRWPVDAQKYVVEVWGEENSLTKICKFIGKKVSILYENIQEVSHSEIPEPDKEMWETTYCWKTNRVLKSEFVEFLPSNYSPQIQI